MRFDGGSHRARVVPIVGVVLGTMLLSACSPGDVNTTDTTTTAQKSSDTTLKGKTKRRAHATTTQGQVRIPAGAEPVGFGTYIEVPPGFRLDRTDETLVTISNGTVSTQFETVDATGDNDPQGWFDGYVEKHKDEAGFAVSTPTRLVGTGPLDSSRVAHYEFASSGIRSDNAFHSNVIDMLFRGDGLLAITIDDDADVGIKDGKVPPSTFEQFFTSVSDAAEIGPMGTVPSSAKLEGYANPANMPVDSFQVVTLDGWTLNKSSSPSSVAQKTADSSFVVTAQPSNRTTSDLVNDAESYLRSLYSPGLTFTPDPENTGPLHQPFAASDGVTRTAYKFSGSYSPTDTRQVIGYFNILARKDGSAVRTVETEFGSSTRPTAALRAMAYSVYASS